MPVCRYVEENSLAALLAAKRSAGVAPEVNVREHVAHMSPPSMNKAPTLASRPSGDVTRSPKQGYHWPHKKDMSYKKFKKRKRNDNLECSLADEHTQR